jgi:hypothetical protein
LVWLSRITRAERDAMIVSLQYGLAGRSQDVFGIRWRSIGDGFAEISWGKLDEWGKTAFSAYRRTAIPQIMLGDLERWRSALRRWGHPARDEDFVIPGAMRTSSSPATSATRSRASWTLPPARVTSPPT